jgi:hypothetical protein
MDNVPYNDRIEFAITNLESQAQPNFSATARKYNIQRTTLTRHFKGESDFKQNAISYISKAFTNVEENILVRYINELNIRELPLILQIVKNLAEEIANKNFNPNWITKFLKRKKNIIRNVYLTIINYKRKVSDNSHYYEHFFTNVRLYFLFIAYYIDHSYLIIRNNRKILYSTIKYIEFR